MNSNSVFALILVGSLSPALATQTTAVADEAAIRSAIGVLESMEQSRHEAVHVRHLTNSNFVNVNGWWWQNHDEIKEAHVRAHQTTFQSSKAEVVTKKVRFLKPDLAIAHAEWKVYGDVRNPAARDYRMTLVLRKTDDRWLITDAQNGSIEDRSSNSITANLTTKATFGSSSQPAQPGSQSDDERAVRRLLAEMDERWSKGDSKSAARSYVEDADTIDTEAKWSRGRSEIEKSMTDFRNRTFNSGRYTTEIAKLVFPTSGIAVATTRWRADTGSANRLLRGMGLLILQKGPAQWQIVASQNTISRGAPPPGQ